MLLLYCYQIVIIITTIINIISIIIITIIFIIDVQVDMDDDGRELADPGQRLPELVVLEFLVALCY